MKKIKKTLKDILNDEGTHFMFKGDMESTTPIIYRIINQHAIVDKYLIPHAFHEFTWMEVQKNSTVLDHEIIIVQ